MATTETPTLLRMILEVNKTYQDRINQLEAENQHLKQQLKNAIPK
jgi:cell shape-determining protein MreC